MPKFRFEHEALLEQRRREEREKQRIVAELQRQRIDVEDALRRTQQAIHACKHELRDALSVRGARIDAGALRLQAGASFHMTVEAQRIAIRLSGAAQRLEAARVQLLEASRRRRAVELWRERRYEAWKRAEDKREQAEIDEIVVMRAAARSREQPS